MRVTRRIADFASAVNFNVATVFGNHDAFYTASALGRKNAPYDKNSSCRVTEQMEMLAPFDVSYRSAAFDDLSLCVCGGRSFSWGGPHWKHREFYRKYIGIHGMTHSTSKMVEAVTSSKFKTVMFLSHSGPTGLGDEQDDPCGRDWGSRRGGDYGDQDLRYAIETARKEGLRVPLTVFGHMHKRLYDDSGDRTMLKTEPDGTSGGQTVMLNAAVCPRQKTSAKTDAMLSHFQIVQLGENGYVLSVEEAWVTPAGDIEESTPLFDASQQAIPIRESAVVQEVVQEIL